MKEIYYLQRKERGRTVELARIENREITIIDLLKKEQKAKFLIKEDVANFIKEADYKIISRKLWFSKAQKVGLDVRIKPTQLDLFHANQLSLF